FTTPSRASIAPSASPVNPMPTSARNVRLLRSGKHPHLAGGCDLSTCHLPLATYHSPSRNDFVNGMPHFHVEPFMARDFEPPGVQSQLVQHRRVNIGYIMSVLDGMVAQLVGAAVDHALLDAAA